MRRALLNLLRNAVEAMPDGGTLTLTTRAEVHDVLVTVADTGTGIQCEDLDRVFTPFFSTKQGGTGLGLAVARQIVTDHGGRLTCQNRPGEGALFTIRLPRQPRKEGRRLAGEVLSRRGGGEVGPYE